MGFELKAGQGTLFKNTRKTTDNHPDYTGEININGKVMWLSAWIKEGKKGKFMSLAAKDKEDQRQTSSPAPKGGSGFDDMSDDIPFIDPYKFNWRSV